MRRRWPRWLLPLILLLVVAYLGVRLTRPARRLEKRRPPAENAPTAAAGEPAVIHLERGMQARLGIRTAAAPAHALAPETRAYGRIEDPAPLAEGVFAREAARAALASARKDAKRVARLYADDRNASERELDAARAALARGRADLEAAQARVVTAWGRKLAGRPDLPALARSLAAGEAALARVDAPAGEAPAVAPAGGSLEAFAGETLEAEFLGPAPTTDPVLQGRGFLFLLRKNPPPPGTAVVARLRAPGAPQAGVTVPLSAVVWNDGRAFVYVKKGPAAFERRSVTLGPAIGDRRFVADGLAPGETVVVRGAQQILSAELMPRSGEPE